MSWVAVVWSVNAGICLALAAVHALSWARSRDRGDLVSLAFASWAVTVAASALVELPLMHSRTPEQYAALVRWIHVPYAAATVTWLLFVRLYLRAGWPWLQWSTYAATALVLVVNFAVEPNINFSRITALGHVPLLGESVAAPIGTPGPWKWIDDVRVALTLAFVAGAVVGAWRKRRKRESLAVGAAIAVSTLGSTVLATMVVKGSQPVPVMVSLPCMATVLFMAVQLSGYLARSHRVSGNLAHSEEMYRTLVQNIPDTTWTTDSRGRTTFISDTCRNILGYRPKEVTADPHFWLSRVHPDDVGRVMQAFKTLFETGARFDIEYRFRHKDGRWIWLHDKAVATRHDGQALIADGVFTDVTDRKQAETALVESERQLSEAQRIARMGSWELNLVTGALTWSSEIYRIFEIDPEGFGASYEAFLAAIHPEDRAAVDAAYRRSLERREPYRIVHRLLLRDGRVKYVEEQCQTHYDEDGKASRSVGTVQDITEHMQVENEKLALRHEMAHLNRVMTLSELSAFLAHEINQPLGAILNNASAARQIMPQGPERQGEIGEILEDITKDAGRASQIVRKIRAVVKREAAEFSSLDLNALVHETVDLYWRLFNANRVNVVLELASPLPSVHGDRVRLQQVLTNLMTNAIEAMRESPVRSLTIRSRVGPDGEAILSVCDAGPGIGAEIRDKVFEPYVTTKKDGLGMGLRICRSIVEEHGGSIWAESEPGAGATFSFTVPTSAERSG